MAFQFAYGIDGESSHSISDFALDTVTNYKNGTNAAGLTKGDLVFLTAGGLVQRATAATVLASTWLGVVEGGEFTGLAQGGIYAATNASFTADALNTTKYPNGVAKVRTEVDAVYRTTLGAGSAPAIGAAVGIIVNGTTGDQTIDSGATIKPLRVIDVQTIGGVTYYYVKLSSAQSM